MLFAKPHFSLQLCKDVKINVYIYSDMEKEHILHINPFCSIHKALLLQKMHACGWKSCGWDTQGLILPGLGSHTILLTAPKNPGRFGSDAGCSMRGGSLWPHSPTHKGLLLQNNRWLPSPAGRAWRRWGIYSILSLFLVSEMGLRMGAGCAGSSNTHTDWQQDFLPRHSLWPAVGLQ